MSGKKIISQEVLASVRLLVFDFDGVFTDNAVYVNQEGIESIRCWRSDGLGLARLRSIGVHILIISTELNPVVTVRAQKLKIPCAAIVEACKELDIDPAHTMFVGNDINDIPALNTVGIPVAVADAYPETYSHIVYQTDKPGGYGAVREVCDLIYFAKQVQSNGNNTHVL